MFLIKGNHEIFVSDEDVDLLINYRWLLQKDGFIVEDLEAYEDELPKADRRPLGYLVLHFEIFKRMLGVTPLKTTQRVKHLNANPLDNRRENLDIGQCIETDPQWWADYEKWKASLAWLQKFM